MVHFFKAFKRKTSFVIVLTFLTGGSIYQNVPDKMMELYHYEQTWLNERHEVPTGHGRVTMTGWDYVWYLIGAVYS